MAKAIKENTDSEVYGFDTHEETLRFVKDEKILDDASSDAKDILSKGDLVIICLYPRETMQFISENLEHFKPGAIVTDAAGLKIDITAFFESLGEKRSDIDFIGGHPMAGSEKKGYENASAALMQSATFLLTPHSGNCKKSIAKLTAFLYEIGFGDVVCLSAEEHDELVAYTSHLPHIIANSLLACGPLKNTKPLEGGSFRDVTRVGKMNTALWQELILSNQPNVLKYLDQFEKQIEAVRQAILKNDAHELITLFDHKAVS